MYYLLVLILKNKKNKAKENIHNSTILGLLSTNLKLSLFIFILFFIHLEPLNSGVSQVLGPEQLSFLICTPSL